MRLKRANERRGVILLVVLALLTLFAIVGITFVLYSDSEATAARIAREGESLQHADMEPEQALALFLSQFIYDVNDDVNGVGSGLRGHSLTRTTYGLGPAGTNTVPFNGVGRLHYPRPGGQDDYNLVNYTWFATDTYLGAPGTVRDPERYGQRASPAAAQTNPYIGGNAPYTYPDLNSFFLGAIKADGTLITPSYHRAWLFNPGRNFNDMTNPNWTNPQGKYMTLRPRPNEHPGFPVPDDATGDVKNLIWAPGGNDSIWIDIGAPVMTAPDGTKYKMLVAPLILDLDGRINLDAHGNIVGAGNTHGSHQGWGPWEVNVSKVLAANATEWTNLFLGNGIIQGKYGANKLPGKTPASATYGRLNHYYAQVNYNPTPPSTIIQPPGFGGAAFSPWPTFGAGYGNGNAAELLNHPLLHSLFQTGFFNPAVNDDHVFRASDMEALLRPNNNFTQATNQRAVDTGSAALISDLVRLCPLHFGPGAASPRYRNLVTTLSMDLNGAGLIPYWYTAAGNTYASANPTQAPVGSSIAFPFPPPLVAGNQPSEFAGLNNWRSRIASPRINLSQTLPSYPHLANGVTPVAGASMRFDTAALQAQFQTAQSARQNLAASIYQVLLNVTGVALPAIPATPAPNDPNLIARRWLAQLAVNIVDYIDEDDISTPFNFYNSTYAGLPVGAVNIGTLNTNSQTPPKQDPELPAFWVFGTEQPHVVINEVLAEHADVMVYPAAGTPDPNTDNLKIWVELYNTLSAGALAAPLQQFDTAPIPLRMAAQATSVDPNAVGGGAAYSPYNLVISNGLEPRVVMGVQVNDNVLGKPATYTTRPAGGTPLPVIEDFSKPWVTFPATAQAGLPTIPAGQSFLLGPATAGDPAKYADPFKPGATTVPNGTPVMVSANLDYVPKFPHQATPAPNPDERQTGVTVFLRRLANPHLPLDLTPALANGNPNPFYNPYVTVDYIGQVAVQDKTHGFTLPAAPPPPPAGTYMSLTKRQPYASLNQVGLNNPANLYNYATAAANSPVYPQTAAPVNGVSHSFGKISNVPAPQSGHFDWMVHLDRVPISPMELLHVSGYQPYQLTQQFVTGANNVPGNLFQHYVPWFDQTRRLYRLFEFLTCNVTGSGVVQGTGNRISGKININTIQDPEIFQALCDANASNWINAPAVIQTMFNNMMASRTPGWATNQLSANDNPFLGMGVGYTAPAANTQWPNGLGIQNTLLRTFPTVNPPPAGSKLLFQNPADSTTVAPQTHPYLQYEMLTKIYNNITTRSNVFAVFLTVGFFQVTNPATTPPTLGAEIGRAEGRHVRHRMFAIVDRTQLPINSVPKTQYDPKTDPLVVPYYSIID